VCDFARRAEARGIENETTESRQDPKCRLRIRIRGQGRLGANPDPKCDTASNRPEPVCRRTGPGSDESVRHELADADTAEQQLGGYAPRPWKPRAEQSALSAVDEPETDGEPGANHSSGRDSVQFRAPPRSERAA